MVSTGAKVGALACILVSSACTGVKDAPWTHRAEAPRVCPTAGDRSALAGSWLYEEQGYIDTLHLDKQGNGAYQWAAGGILTACLDQPYWSGTWKQAEGEGGFEIKLSKDLNSGEGRRWSGRETGPNGAVSKFQVKRIGAVAQSGESPAASLAGREAAPR